MRILELIFSIATLATPATAFACDVTAATAVDARWSEAVEALRRWLSAHPFEAAGCQSITLEPSDTGAQLRFVTPDGRQATRPVERPQDLEPVVEALLVSVPQPEPDPPTEQPAARPAARPTQQATQLELGIGLGGLAPTDRAGLAAIGSMHLDLRTGHLATGATLDWMPAQSVSGSSLSSFSPALRVGLARPRWAAGPLLGAAWWLESAPGAAKVETLSGWQSVAGLWARFDWFSTAHFVIATDLDARYAVTGQLSKGAANRGIDALPSLWFDARLLLGWRP
jgi:hypothetical protein